MDRLRKEGAELVNRCAKQHSEPSSDKRGARVDELRLTPLAAPAQALPLPTQSAPCSTVEGVPIQPVPVPLKRSPAHYLWAALIAHIYEVFPLLCPICGGQMRLIAFITHSVDIRQILDHIGVESEPPHISTARGPPLGDDCDAQKDDRGQAVPDWDMAAQPVPDYEVDQRINW